MQILLRSFIIVHANAKSKFASINQQISRDIDRLLLPYCVDLLYLCYVLPRYLVLYTYNLNITYLLLFVCIVSQGE